MIYIGSPALIAESLTVVLVITAALAVKYGSMKSAGLFHEYWFIVAVIATIACKTSAITLVLYGIVAGNYKLSGGWTMYTTVSGLIMMVF